MDIHTAAQKLSAFLHRNGYAGKVQFYHGTFEFGRVLPSVSIRGYRYRVNSATIDEDGNVRITALLNGNCVERTIETRCGSPREFRDLILTGVADLLADMYNECPESWKGGDFLSEFLGMPQGESFAFEI